MAETIRIENATLPAEGHSVRVSANGTPVAVFLVGGTLRINSGGQGTLVRAKLPMTPPRGLVSPAGQRDTSHASAS